MRKDMNLGVLKILDNHNMIFFGPFLGSLEWEILHWSGFIRWYVHKYPNKDFVICTRPERVDLYTNMRAKIISFKMDNIDDSNQNRYFCDIPESAYTKLMKNIYDDYKTFYFMLNPIQYKLNDNVYSMSQMNFDLEPSELDIMKIDHIIKNKNIDKDGKNKKRIPIFINSRCSNHLNMRNWSEKKWTELIELLNNKKKYIIFLGDVGENKYAKPIYIDSDSEIVDLKKYIIDENDSSTLLGLSIAAMTRCKLCVGMIPSEMMILSNLLGNQSVIWGDDIKKYAYTYNPFSSKIVAIESKEYSVEPFTIYQYINNIFGKIRT